MKRFAVPILLALAVAGCASIVNPINTTRLGQIESSYGVALSVAVAYRDLCAKRLISPDCRTVVPKVQAADRAAQASLATAREFVKNNPTLNAFSVLEAAQAAVDGLKAVTPRIGG